jgi:lectin-like protein
MKSAYFSSFLALVFTASASAAVLSGPITNPANGHAYYLLTRDTWNNSEAQAIALNGHLATINDLAEDHWVADTFNGDFAKFLWIGFTDAGHEGDWRWISAEPVTFTAWDFTQPDNGAGGPPENWAHLGHGDPYVWNDYQDVTIHIGAGKPLHGVVEVVPEPGTAALLGCAVIFLRRRPHTHLTAR